LKTSCKNWNPTQAKIISRAALDSLLPSERDLLLFLINTAYRDSSICAINNGDIFPGTFRLDDGKLADVVRVNAGRSKTYGEYSLRQGKLYNFDNAMVRIGCGCAVKHGKSYCITCTKRYQNFSMPYDSADLDRIPAKIGCTSHSIRRTFIMGVMQRFRKYSHHRDDNDELTHKTNSDLPYCWFKLWNHLLLAPYSKMVTYYAQNAAEFDNMDLPPIEGVLRLLIKNDVDTRMLLSEDEIAKPVDDDMLQPKEPSKREIDPTFDDGGAIRNTLMEIAALREDWQLFRENCVRSVICNGDNINAKTLTIGRLVESSLPNHATQHEISDKATTIFRDVCLSGRQVVQQYLQPLGNATSLSKKQLDMGVQLFWGFKK